MPSGSRKTLNQKVCKAHPANDHSESYSQPGDLGFFYENELYLTGRLKYLIIVNGKN